ncbi:MAG: hypothetical protein GY941_21670 [Planctomycetes bacterium]|nr:hypothetical protein [Planctomycetota bacterium]
MTKRYDTNKIICRHQQLALWMGPVWCSKASYARFEDAVGEQPVGDAVVDPVAEPAAVPDESAADLLSNLPAADAAKPDSLLNVAGLVNPDGTFVDAWHESDLLPEGLRGDKSLAVFKNLSDLSKSYVNTKSMVGGNKVALPKEGSSAEEIATFWKSVSAANPELGPPKTADGYEVEIPDDMKEVFTDDRVTAAKEMAMQIGISKAQFAAYMKADMAATQTALAQQDTEDRRVYDENVLALKKEWGEAYAERQHVVKRLIAEAFGTDKQGELDFLQNYAGDPDFVRFAANIGVRLVESKAIVAEMTQSTPIEAERKITELRATPGYLTLGSDLTDDQRNDITNQINELYQQAYPNKKTG